MMRMIKGNPLALVACLLGGYLLGRALDTPCPVVTLPLGQIRIMVPGKQVAQRAHVPRSSHDQEHWARVQNGVLNIHDPSVDTYISGSIQRSGTWEPAIERAMREILGKDKNLLVVDVGANIGYFSFVAALKGHRVISFEPMLYNIRQMERTMYRNYLPRWSVYRNVASNVTGQVVTLHQTDASVNAGNHRVGPGNASAYTVRLDDVVREDVAFLKVDVEGYEALVVAGASKLFCTHTVYAVVLETGGDNGVHIKWMTTIGYKKRDLPGDTNNAFFVLPLHKKVVTTHACLQLAYQMF